MERVCPDQRVEQGNKKQNKDVWIVTDKAPCGGFFASGGYLLTIWFLASS